MTEPMTCESCDLPVDPADRGAVSEWDGSVRCEGCREAAYDREQERLMECGPGPTLQEQQVAALRVKRGGRP